MWYVRQLRNVEYHVTFFLFLFFFFFFNWSNTLEDDFDQRPAGVGLFIDFKSSCTYPDLLGRREMGLITIYVEPEFLISQHMKRSINSGWKRSCATLESFMRMNPFASSPWIGRSKVAVTSLKCCDTAQPVHQTTFMHLSIPTPALPFLLFYIYVHRPLSTELRLGAALQPSVLL